MLIDQFGLDGIDFDWQYPGIEDDWIEEDKDYFIKYLNGFRQSIQDDKIISVSVAARPEDIARSYKVEEFVDLVDFINLKTYNLRGTPSNDNSITAFHSPLFKRSDETEPESAWNIHAIVRNWNSKLEKDISEKLIIGIPTFGRSFELSNSEDFSVGAQARGIGANGKVLPLIPDFNGVLAYREICRNIVNDEWIDHYDEQQVSSYAVYNEDQWVGYDSIESAVAKILYVRDNNFGGVNYVRLELEDFSE